jgi:hypothetical protein
VHTAMLLLLSGFWRYLKVGCPQLVIIFTEMTLASRDHKDSVEFRRFRRDLFHSSLQHILSSLWPHMMTPRVTRCGDGHYRRVIYCLGPYIADYPEQVLLACIVQGWCPRYVQYSVKNMTPTELIILEDVLRQGPIWIPQHVDDRMNIPRPSSMRVLYVSCGTIMAS